jgi:hypothetical protein
MPPTPAVLDDEIQIALDASGETDDAYGALLGRLSRQSVDKHFDAYADVDWDAPEMAIDPADPRWELTDSDPLGRTEWYRSQAQEVRAGIGLARVAHAMKVGLQFENVLERGLLEYAFSLPNGSPEFRYVYHEVAEETHHTMMFQEFVNRSAIDPKGMPWHKRIGSRRVVLLGRRFPPLFFFFVLGGEDPIDFVQRRMLREGSPHPLLERIMRIHVTEEARHLSFARHYLRREVPRLGRVRRTILSLVVPVMLGEMSKEMLHLPRTVTERYAVPRDVVRAAYSTDDARQHRKDAVRKVRNLCADLGLVNPLARRLWRRVGLWDDGVRSAM